MTATAHEARTDMETLVEGVITVWNASHSDAEDFTLIKQDADRDAPTGTTPYCRMTLKHNTGKASLADESMRRRYDRRGVLMIQVFTKFGDGFALADAFVNLLADATEGQRTPNGVVFHRVQRLEVGKSGKWSQMNFTAEFQYDEIK